jgi:hemolysin activation/secretion protein
MGRVEDIAVGYGYNMSLGYGSPLYGSDRSETLLNWLFSLSLSHEDSLFVNTQADFTTRFSNEPRDSVFKGKIKLIRKNLLRQTLAAQLSTIFEFGLARESQVILDGENGMRGYSPYAFNGEKMVILNLESRTIFSGGIFEKLESLIVVGSAMFLDFGYIWSGDEFVLSEPKRSVGAGLRFSIPRLSGSRVFRFDLAYPLDVQGGTSRIPVITYGIGHVF